MLVDFNKLDSEAKIFLYPSNKKFYPELLKQLQTQLDEFVALWAKKNEIEAGYSIKHQRFIIIAINPTKPVTTFVIDELVSFIFKLQLAFDIELLDKLNVCFKQGEHIQYKDVKAFKKLIKNKSVNKDTIVFDHLITTKQQLETDWELPAKDSWYHRMF